MAYFASADDYKQFFELSGQSKPSDDYVNVPSEVVQPMNPLGPTPTTTSIEKFSFNKRTGKFEPFRFNKNTGGFEPFRNVKNW